MSSAPRMKLHSIASASIAFALVGFVTTAAQAQHRECKDGFCWEIHPPTYIKGDIWVKITKWPWPRSTHRNIRWNCEGGRGCQIEGDTLRLPSGVKTWYVSVQACIRGFAFNRSTCSPWTNFVVY